MVLVVPLVVPLVVVLVVLLVVCIVRVSGGWVISFVSYTGIDEIIFVVGIYLRISLFVVGVSIFTVGIIKIIIFVYLWYTYESIRLCFFYCDIYLHVDYKIEFCFNFNEHCTLENLIEFDPYNIFFQRYPGVIQYIDLT